MEPRLKTALWVQALIRHCALAARAAVVLRKGDPDLGGVVLVLRAREGLVPLVQARDGQGRPAWLRALGETPADEAALDAYVARAVGRDPDLWVVEIEAPDGTPPFETRIV